MADAGSTKGRKKLLFREEQIYTLNNFISCPWEVFPNLLLLIGHDDTGKSSTVEEVIRGLEWEYRIARADCGSYISLQVLFTSLLDQLVRHLVSEENDYKSRFRVNNMYEFIRELKKAAHNRATKTFRFKKMFIILKHCDTLVKLDPTLPNLFMSLQEMSQLRVTVIMLASEVSFTFRFQSQPMVIRFPQYTKDEMVMILNSERPQQYDNESNAYENYVKMMLHIMFRDCRQLHVIRSQVVAHAGVAMSGDLDSFLMWGRVRVAVSTLLHGDLPAPLPPVTGPRMMDQVVPGLLTETATTQNIDLPFCAKLLLIAALLAAHIPPSADAKIFVSARPDSKRRKCKKRKIVQAPSITRMLLGPRTFPMDRLFAIFYAIVEEPFPLTVQLQAQVSTLVKLELLRDVSADLLADRKLALTASVDMITKLAQMVDFDLGKYLSLVA